MDLQQTIDELEKQAAKYTEAANALRALLQDGMALPLDNSKQASATPQSNKSNKSASGTKAKANQKGAKRVMSPETKAKLAAAMKARHQQKKEAQAS